MPTWRDTSLTFVDIGRNLADIEMAIRGMRAITAVSDKSAIDEVHTALRAGRQLVRALEALRHDVEKSA